MRSIDQELAEALGPDPAAAPAPDSKPGVARPAPPPNPPPSPKRNLGLLLGVGAVTAGIVVLAVSIEGGAYAKTVDQLVAQRARMAGREVRVQGILVKGSLVYQEQPCEYRFTIANQGVELNVRYPVCVVPDTFRDSPTTDVEVTATGKLAATGGVFEATGVMAKCPSKY
ncbi:MAG TPA: cytochrome c maturation protein CcmE [Polyangiaceae bacterium]|nr:cytochrome c maturation protein CcmE [Polyangiaceae bacterium]